MKLKKILALTMAALMLLTVVSCSKKDDTASAEEIQNRMNELYDEENALFAEHADQWNIVFNNIDKEAAMNNTDDYATFIKKNIEACAALLSDDDRAILDKDAERIAEIEEEIMTLSEKLGTSDIPVRQIRFSRALRARTLTETTWTAVSLRTMPLLL